MRTANMAKLFQMYQLSFSLLVTVIFTVTSGHANAFDIVLLGDNARVKLLQQCKIDCEQGKLIFGTPRQGSSASEIANIAQNARHGILVIDATSGPLPITREHILIARQAGVPSLSLMFVNIPLLEGISGVKESINLQEREVRKLMDAYTMSGSNAMVFHDALTASTKNLHSNGIGFGAVVKKMYSIPEHKTQLNHQFPRSEFSAVIYLLSVSESENAVKLKENSKVRIWVNGNTVDAHIRSKTKLNPGDVDNLVFESETPIVAPHGSKLLLERNGGIIAAGILSN